MALKSPFEPAHEILVLIALSNVEAQASLRKYADSTEPLLLAYMSHTLPARDFGALLHYRVTNAKARLCNCAYSIESSLLS